MKKLLKKIYNWSLRNERKIIFLIIVHIGVSFILRLPYLNLFTLIVSSLIYLIDWILILVLFKPVKEDLLKAAFGLFLLFFPFSLLQLIIIIEIIGQVGYLLILTYIIQAIREDIKNK